MFHGGATCYCMWWDSGAATCSIINQYYLRNLKYFTQLPDKLLNYCGINNHLAFPAFFHMPSGTVVSVCVFRRFLFCVAQNNRHSTTRVHDLRKWKMVCSSVGLSFADVLWAFFALFFLVALCVHKISQHLPKKYETCRLYVLFQDLIRYGQTKQNLKRDDWLRVFDLPKR